MRRSETDANRADGWRGVAFVRLVPPFDFDWVSYAAGLSRMPLGSYLSATLVGMLLPVLAIVAVGGSPTESPLHAASICGALVLVALTPLVWRSWTRWRVVRAAS